MTRLRRLAFLCGALLLAAAVFNVLHFPAMDWYADAILQASGIAAGELLLLAVIVEFAARLLPGPSAQRAILVFAVIPALWPTFYVCFAAWAGRETAQFDTWHLLALFAIVNFAEALVFSAILVLGIAGLIGARNAIRRRS
jgi:hypothetical protein